MPILDLTMRSSAPSLQVILGIRICPFAMSPSLLFIFLFLAGNQESRYLFFNLFSFTYIISTIKIPSTPTLNNKKYTHHVRGKKRKKRKGGAKIRQDQSQTIGDKYLLYQKETKKKKKRNIYLRKQSFDIHLFLFCKMSHVYHTKQDISDFILGHNCQVTIFIRTMK